MMFPDLSGLSLLPRGADVGTAIPNASVTAEVEDRQLPGDVLTKTGLIASAGAKKDMRKKALLRKIASKYKADKIWTGKRKWLYAYWNTDHNLAALVLDLQFTGIGPIAYRLLGDAQIKPNEYVVANIHKHWTTSAHWDGHPPPDPNTASAWFESDADGTVTRGLFEYIRDRKGMAHWQDFESVEDVLALVRAGEKLPIMWMDDGMEFIYEYLQKLNRL